MRGLDAGLTWKIGGHSFKRTLVKIGNKNRNLRLLIEKHS